MARTAWVLLVSLLAGAATARAQQMPALPTGVRIVLATCNTIVPRQPLLEQLRIELLSTGVVDIDVVDPDTADGARGEKAERIATLQVYYPECDDSGSLVNLRISDRLTSKYVERTLVVSDISAEARPRAVALAIVELLRASWLELVIAQEAGRGNTSSDVVRNRLVTRLREATDDDPGVPQARPRRVRAEPEEPTASELAEAAEERWNKTRLEWIGGGRLYSKGASGDLSTTVKLSFALNRRLRLHTGAIAAGGGLQHDSDVTMFEGAGVLGVGLSGGTSPEIEVASIFEVGWSRISGQDVNDVSRAMALGSLQGTIRTQVTPGVDALLGVQAGFVLAPSVLKTGMGSERKVVGGFDGPVIGVLVGLAGIL